MRLISQDGKGDMPYEGFVFRRHGGTIIASKDVITSEKSIVAQYSSEEKAKKAMTCMQCDFAVGELYFQFPKDDEVEA